MIRQHSFENDHSCLYIVPTPIGNLDEMTPRAISVLKDVDVIACEDTRTSGVLLKHFDIRNHLISYHNFNEEQSSKGILQLLEEGKNVALISDAGYPLINDPGQRIVSLASEKGFNVIPLSGASAFLDALVASGQIVQPFLFVGFLPSSHGDRVKKLREYEVYPMTSIYYEAPHRIEQTLTDMLDIYGDRNITLVRELTKMHEEFIRGKISEILMIIHELRGEMVIVVSGKKQEKYADVDMSQIMDMIDASISAGLSAKDAVKEVSLSTGVAKNRIKEAMLQKKC